MDLNQKGISPVVGTILLVAVTVIIAGVIAAFAMGLGKPAAAPIVNLSKEVDENIYIYNDGGDTIKNAPESLSVKLNGNTISSDNVKVTGGGNDLEVGGRMEISADFSRGGQTESHT